jgi:3-hydroxyacyl-CoA dehydrogenase
VLLKTSATSTGKDLLPFVTEGFTAAAMAKVGTSAIEAQEVRLCARQRHHRANKDELLFVALNEAKAMFNSGYRAPAQTQVPGGWAQWSGHHQGPLVNMRDGGFISAHDFYIASLIANVV